jgi:hypothetical protein
MRTWGLSVENWRKAPKQYILARFFACAMVEN